MAETASIPVIKQGDAYSLRVPLTLNDEAVTADSLPLIHCVEFFLGEEIRKVWPDDGAFADDVFYVPLTQEETFNLDEGTSVEFDVRVHFIGGAVVGLKKKLKVKVYDAISEVVLNE